MQQYQNWTGAQLESLGVKTNLKDSRVLSSTMSKFYMSLGNCVKLWPCLLDISFPLPQIVFKANKPQSKVLASRARAKDDTNDSSKSDSSTKSSWLSSASKSCFCNSVEFVDSNSFFSAMVAHGLATNLKTAPYEVPAHLPQRA